MPGGRTGRASNYAYGRSMEKSVARTLMQVTSATSYRRTPGSRGPADFNMTKEGEKKYSVQVKASRASSKSTNTISPGEKQELIKYSKEMGTVPLIAHAKGSQKVITYAESGKILYKSSS
jgi:hypothetical protein